MIPCFSKFKAVTKEICKLPSFFSIVLFQKIDVNGTEFVTSVALMRLAEMDYCGTTSYIIKIFIDKKYALPYLVLDALVAHFMRFVEDSRVMLVIWHQTLLAFVQRFSKHQRRGPLTKRSWMKFETSGLLTSTIGNYPQCNK
ncbi:essential nuclear protein 1 isoform X2 [Spinacia oleracea]|uniref:Essential nuclear protein 1 isoform X2 n=1 Tax=Spinacia oleracea TaxID=3562 RepID=A0A9R0IQR1_SPIOL|nr:essential nuclear protein 1-like isoform X2 [Spinacia oleracea]